MALGTRRERAHAATRAEVLAVAWDTVRRDGLAALSFSELARAVGMRPPSLYTYFDSKHAIYDAMFAEGAQTFLDDLRSITYPDDPREGITVAARAFFRFCTSDPARYQLLFQRTVPGFEPSPASYAIAVDALALAATELARRGIDRAEHLDLLTALMTGLVDQQISNDPGGDRWERLIDDAVDMFVHHVGRRSR